MTTRATVVTDGKMSDGAYRAIHQWVERRLGKPHACENCGSATRASYEWANLSGEYLYDISDWARLCRYCHHLIDDVYRRMERRPPAPKCIRGHDTTPDNTYVNPGTGYRTCRICKRLTFREYQRDYRARKRAESQMK